MYDGIPAWARSRKETLGVFYCRYQEIPLDPVVFLPDGVLINALQEMVRGTISHM